MRELNPIGRDEDVLLLVSSDGERFSLVVDDELLRTIKSKKISDAPGLELTPRQIQDAIRSGATISELAESSGSSLDFIERFAHPVLEELKHIVSIALAVRIELPADRFNEVAKRPFGEIIEEKLVASGASSIRWSAKRGENSIWQVTVTFNLGSSDGVAAWSFDPKNYSLSPESPTAQNLSNIHSELDRGLFPKPAAKDVTSEPVVTEDNLVAFRTRRERREKLEAEATPEAVLDDLFTEDTGSPESLEVLEDPTQELEADDESAEVVVAEDTPVNDSPSTAIPKKGRAPMPSWDEIVRGTGSDEGDSF